MKRIFLIVITLLTSLILYAQVDECSKDFDYIVNRIRNDYPGYLDKVNDNNIQELKQHENYLRKKIIDYPDSCKKYFDEYVSWFKDYHLRVSYNYNNTITDDSKEVQKKYYNIEPEDIAVNRRNIEGIWTGFWGNLAIVKQDTNKYLGVAMNYKGFEKNQIIFECADKREKNFDLTTYWNFRNYKPHKELASLHLNNQVLEIHDYTRFVRSTNDSIFDKALLLSYIPGFPNGLNTFPVALYLSDSTFYLRIPSFYSDLTEKLITKHWDDIESRPNLIIDIRNNTGGQDYFYNKLAELIYTGPYESKGVEWYASKGLINDLELAIEKGEIKEGFEEEAENLLTKMKTNVGGFVNHPYYDGDSITKMDTVYKYPKKVGIIINENNASSAEQFILTAQHSSKVITFGNKNTAGILDYSNITPKELPSGKYYLWLPATRSKRLPENPIDNIGIAPDIKIPLEPEEQLYDRLDAWVYFVKRYLENKEN